MNRIIFSSVLWMVILGGAVAWGGSTAAAGAELVASALTNKMCPVITDEPVDPEVFAEYQGQKVYFCCPKCRRRFQRNPAKYAEGLGQVMPARFVAASGDKHDPAAASTDAHQSNHDHATGHDPRPHQQPVLARPIAFVGQFHPLVIHFPIALLTAGAVAELLFMATGLSWLTAAARFSVICGAVGAVGAAPLGWARAAFANYGTDMAWVLTTHRWLGTTVALLSLVVVSLSEANARRPGSKLRLWYRAVLFAVTLLVGITGHFGATLVFGSDYFTW